MKKVVIVDYGLGNIFSIKQALHVNGCDPLVSSNPEDLANADGILLPGVGAFGDAMAKLQEKNLVGILREQAQKGKPFLGVCLGLQLLFSKSEEFGEHEGLGIIPGTVKKFPASFAGTPLTVPFIGWNVLGNVKSDTFVEGLNHQAKMFLVHSFFVQPEDKTCVLASCFYQGFEYPVVIRKGNVFGVQGHPEKSGQDGLKVYANWLSSL
jgi:glutamine amidotransferase